MTGLSLSLQPPISALLSRTENVLTMTSGLEEVHGVPNAGVE